MPRSRSGPRFRSRILNVGLLFILAISSLGIYGIVLGGWASNSHYSLLGALRSAAQLVSYETAAGLGAGFRAAARRHAFDEGNCAGASTTRASGSFSSCPFGFFIYLVGSIAETNRAPFDLPEAESELVAGYMTEYSGFRWSLYFLAEYANMIVVAGNCHDAVSRRLAAAVRAHALSIFRERQSSFSMCFPRWCFLALRAVLLSSWRRSSRCKFRNW